MAKVATTQTHDGTHTIVTYHRTQVVKFNDNEIVLNSGGYRTPTTKKRMNQTSEENGLNVHIYQDKGDWFVARDLNWDKPIEFVDNMVITR